MVTLDSQVLESIKDSETALEACVASANKLLRELVADFRLVGVEVADVRGSLEEYTNAYRNYGIAQIMSDYFKSMGIPFRAGLEDPVIEHSENIRQAALSFIKTLRELGCDSQDINSISDALKQHGESARISGTAEGILMLLKV